MSDLFGGDKDQTTTQEVKFPSYVENAQKALLKGAEKGIAPFLGNSGTYVAPLDPNQTRVGTGANSLADFAAGSNYGGNVPSYSGQFGDMMGTLDRYIPGFSQQAIDASTIGMNDIMGFANPYADAVMDNGTRRLDDAYASSQADLGARAAAGGAFGGSREAVGRNMLDEDRMNAVKDLTTQTMYDSYGMGASLARGNADARTSALMQAGGDIYNRAAGAAGFDLNALGSAADFDLSRLGTIDNLATNYTARNASALGLLGGYGDLSRSYAQQVGDKDFTQFSRFASLIPGIQGTTVQSQPTNNSGWLGTALTAASMFL